MGLFSSIALENSKSKYMEVTMGALQSLCFICRGKWAQRDPESCTDAECGCRDGGCVPIQSVCTDMECVNRDEAYV